MSQRPPIKRARTSLACEGCRSRKISCDGERPCSRCRLEGRACTDPKTQKRTPLTRTRMTELEERIAKYEYTWSAIHPSVTLETACTRLSAIGAAAAIREFSVKSQHELPFHVNENLSSRVPDDGPVSYPPTRPASPRAMSLGLAHEMSSVSHGALNTWVECDAVTDSSPGNADSVIPLNDYGTGVRGGVGYMGLSSAATLLRAIQKFDPMSIMHSNHQNLAAWHAPKSALSPGRTERGMHPTFRLPPASEIRPLTDSYFEYFHTLHPLVHEPTIRAQLTGALPLPGSASNQVLINMIFATGAFDSATIDDGNVGANYYEVARAHLQQDLFAEGSLVLVQGLAIMAIYLQRRNKPNAGYVALGLAIRMAMALGIHVSAQDEKVTGLSLLESEIRTRVFWCLVAIEAGMSMTYGRPHGITLASLATARLPANVEDEDLTVSTTNKPPEATHVTRYTALIIQARLAQLAFRSLDRISRSLPSPTVEQVKWCGDYFRDQQMAMPPYMRSPAPSAYRLACAIQTWRARHYRAVLYRPVFLSAAWSNGATAASDKAVREIIDNCRVLALDNLHDISDFVRANPDSHRGTEWYTLYFAMQASLTLLLSIVWEPQDQRAPEWRASILRTIDWLYRLHSMKELGTSYARVMEGVLSNTRIAQPAPPAYTPSEVDTFNFERYFAEIWDGQTQVVGLPDDFFLAIGVDASEGFVDALGTLDTS